MTFLHWGFACAESSSAHEEMPWAQTPAEGVASTLPHPAGAKASARIKSPINVRFGPVLCQSLISRCESQLQYCHVGRVGSCLCQWNLCRTGPWKCSRIFPKVTTVTISTRDTWYPVTASLCLSMASLVVLVPSSAGRAGWVQGPWSCYEFWAGLQNNAFVRFYFPFANEKCSLPSPH